MGNSVVYVLILVGCFSIAMCMSSCFQGTRAVTWTLYSNVKLRWNEASRFCKERGGHLPVTNTNITMDRFQQVVISWKTWPTGSTVWLGLHSSVSGKIPNVWDRDCCLLPPSVQHWATDLGEPDTLDSQRCCRMNVETSSGGWRTTPCTASKFVVCETDRGNCTYEPLNDTAITTLPDASKGYVNDVSTCWSLCLELRHNGEECVAAVLETTLCKLYVGQKLLETNDSAMSPSNGSIVMLRRCFHTARNETFILLAYNNGSSDPNFWSVTCPDVYKPGVDPPDFLPPGVEPGLVTMTTSLPATTETAAPDTIITTSASTASSPSTQSASTTSSSSTQPASPVADDTMTTSPPPPPPLSSTNSVNSVESPSPETTVGTVTENVTTADPKPTLCPCSCSYKFSSTRQNPVNLTAENPFNLTVIPRNQMSKYRRAKTSVWTGQTSHAVIGSPWVVAGVCICCSIVLCDLSLFKRHLCAYCAARKNSVAPGP